MADKPYFQMTDGELREAHEEWTANCRDASGWASAYFSAKQLAAIVEIGNKRGLGLVNEFPITYSK